MKNSRSQGVCLRLESLEDRCCPSSVSVIGHTMYILGDAGANTVSIQDNGRGTITASIDSHTRTANNINNIIVNTKGGNDTVNYTLSGQLQRSENLSLNLGDGNDTANLNFSAGQANANLRVNVLGGAGDDRVTATFGRFDHSNLSFRSDLGSGNDACDVTMSGALVNRSHVNFNVAGGLGNDTIAFHANASPVDVEALSSLYFRIWGGRGQDNVSLDYQGRVNGKLNMLIDGQQDVDTLTANVTLNSGSTGQCDTGIRGGLGVDQLALHLNDVSGPSGTSTMARVHSWTMQ